MSATLLEQGLNLMLFGMGIVFVFLSLLVGAISLTSRILSTFGGSDPQLKSDSSQTQNDAPIAAIAAGIERYRRSRKL